MVLYFPDLDILRLALTTAAVPPQVSATAAAAAFDDQGGVWVRPSVPLPPAALKELQRLGVRADRAAGRELGEAVSSWPELLPLRRVEPDAGSESAPVLFDLPAGQLTELVTEMLRLGNDRQSFRWLARSDSAESERVLLRVVGPPYYSLLRALDRDGRADAPAAFVERAPRVWVQLGYAHPLGEQLKAPEGQVLLLSPPRDWRRLDEAPFRDIYDVLEFVLPGGRAAWRETEPARRLRVPLRLAPGGPAEEAELWVLRDRSLEQLDELVKSADDHLLRQLSFAVAEYEGQQVVVLHARPSRFGPPVLVIDGVGFRTHLKLPNLFLPAGTRLHPPLRRDAVRRLLADDPAVLTWLYPHGDGRFTPEGLPDQAFRPLSDWVDYVLDHDRRELQLWVESAQFDFEPFVCADEQGDRPSRPRPPAKDRPRKLAGDAETKKAPAAERPAKTADRPRRKEGDDFAALPRAEPSELQKRLRALEERFVGLEGPLDGPERQALWPQLAGLNAALGHGEDAVLCWLHALWSEEAPAPWAWSWLRADAAAATPRSMPGQPRARSWAARLEQTRGAEHEQIGDDLDFLLGLGDPTRADLSALAAYLVWAAGQDAPPAALVERLGRLQRFLEVHEGRLPVRAVWLAWLGLARLAGGDVLALARARDRLLERLYQGGLRPEQDLPGFLRFSGQPSGDRLRAARGWLLRLNDLAHRWVTQGGTLGHPDTEATPAYVDLLFAFGLARTGDADAGRRLLVRAKSALAEGDDVHSVLLQAFTYRIEQAQQGKPHAGPLPPEQLEYVQKELTRTQRYLVEKLRQHSRVLEPDQEVEAYRHFEARADALEKELAGLPDVLDRGELAERVGKLLPLASRKGQPKEARAKVLKAALEQAPRVSEAFAVELLGQVPSAYDALEPADDPGLLLVRAGLLEKGLLVAAHFDQKEYVHQLVGRFRELLEAQRGPHAVQALEPLAGQSFRGLRKLGMRDEIDHLLQLMARLILESQEQDSVRGLLDHIRGENSSTGGSAWLPALLALLRVAAGWLYFGRDKQAEPVLSAARALLYEGQFGQPQQRAALACAYVTTLGQAPVEVVRQRLEELFHRLDGLRDAFTTCSHYGILRLRVVEAVVRTVVNEDAALGRNVRRWLDDDEYLVRQRVHRDLKAVLAHADG